MRKFSLYVIFTTCLVASVGITCGATTETIFNLNNLTTPLVARQEKAQGLLRTWEFVAPGFIEQFRLSAEEDVATVQSALDALLSKQTRATTATEVSSEAEHYLVWAVARAQMVNSVDFSEPRLRHFFELNKNRYPCSPRAVVSEIMVPRAYVDDVGTTAILVDIAVRLEKESFPRVAYHIHDQLGQSGTGYRGEVTLEQAGNSRFELYRQVAETGEPVGGSGDPAGGPFETPDGWLYIQVHSLVASSDDCFGALKNQVAQDYGREWLKKIHADTLTTALQELKPDLRPYTTSTALSDIAFVVDGHARTFAEARALLPFLMGDERVPEFWQSIQRQALDIELLYHSSTGKQVRVLPEYGSLLGTLAVLSNAQAKLRQQLNEPVTTETLQRWYTGHQSRYTSYGAISYIIFDCYTTGTASVTPATQAECAAALASLRSGQWESGRFTFKEDVVTSASFESQSREIQVASHGLQPGEWSEVFTEDERPRLLRLQSVEKSVPRFEKVARQVHADYLIEMKLAYWRTLVGAESPTR